ncbi:MAG: 4-(cytidine 5'-diphospho)-2-C-methyl-D-erythritol kinase [Clostridia bacterium]|nr:4-(cytidine 5'-diphospho)-2-C-methyl-D-erythritol kinase [Oscillospiraceae bacterium]MBO7423024.1 4-(cytidine 5'-diphospho)-2-C-methyl-D-erythritol kinase [Oscillospiraceae bacterium]MBO7728772.1 4-(cytidine 5'-diphospho)-2-C-methyl-D-erythritol kinase [Oscillospiraceae bacterium]MBP5167954.1 4-(cytidine 5'-diphospho)-2-C-methyl-D-erythritol kinase [Oscillospiraceae bacterium]MBP5725848.1 4-(cytidine 5'-diphospho)-2-C-methyl-D-erythritol kinase [Clostridia bacterium]
MNTITEKAYAKLNISLDVSKAREDGYHDMVMVMQTVSLCDELSITLDHTGVVRAEADLRYIPRDDRNLAVKAAKLYFARTGREETGAVIRMKKRIPVGAGMAGGSSDAAAVIRALNRTFGQELTKEEMMALAEQTGSDVAFCVVGGTALAEGRGEILTPLRDMPDCTIVICKPDYSISTPELFRAIDREKLRIHPDTAGILEAIREGNLAQICRRMYNVFEDVPDRRMKIIGGIKTKLINKGAEGAVMTGTGSAVFGIFTDENTAKKACSAMSKEVSFTCVAKPVGALL